MCIHLHSFFQPNLVPGTITTSMPQPQHFDPDKRIGKGGNGEVTKFYLNKVQYAVKRVSLFYVHTVHVGSR